MTIYFFTTLGYLLFLIGLTSMFYKNNTLINYFISLELMFLAININLLIYALFWDSIDGQVLAIFILTVAGVESAIGLALLILLYNIYGTIQIKDLRGLRK